MTSLKQIEANRRNSLKSTVLRRKLESELLAATPSAMG
jgi:hypothetical protein